MEYLNPIIIQCYDFEEMITHGYEKIIFQATQNYEKNDEFFLFHINQIDKIDRANVVNILGFYGRNGMRSTRQVHIQKYMDTNAQLLKVLREEYHLE